MMNSTGLERITEWTDTWKRKVPINPPTDNYVVVRVSSEDVVMPRETWVFLDWHGCQEGMWFSPDGARKMPIGGYHDDGVYNNPDEYNFVAKGAIYAVREDWLKQQEEKVSTP
jgi:hypothetical protein